MNQSLWYGLNKGAPPAGLANTSCSDNNCTGAPFPIAVSWIQKFVLNNATADISKLSSAEYDAIFRLSINEYASTISAADPDLAGFRDAGGKMITWHGLADQLIPPDGTYNYYQRVLAQHPEAADYYRFFPAPGIYHCSGGPGWYPGGVLDSLVNWVEKGIAPDTLEAKTETALGASRTVNLCAYPKILTYQGGDINSSTSFTCK